MFNLLTGNCAQCKEIKELSILRDGWGVCCECNEMLTESGERGETTQCFYCHYMFSRLWGKFNHLGNFICRECLPEEICSGCGKLARICFISRNLCQECVENKTK